MTRLPRISRKLAFFLGEIASCIATWINFLAILSLGALVIVLAGSAIIRYAFHAPVPYTEELSALLFISISFLSLAKVFARGGHITFGGKSTSVDDKRNPARRTGALVLAAVVLALLLFPTLEFANFSRQLGARSSVAEIPLWPWMSLIPLGLSTLLLVVIGRLIALVVDLSGSRRRDS